MKGWNEYHRKRDRMDRKRCQRLRRKLQKAGALDRAGEVLSLPSWGKRFRRTARLRVCA